MGFGQFADFAGGEEGGGGLFKEEGVVFFEWEVGLDTPMHTILLGQTEEEEKTFLGGSKEGSLIVRLPTKALSCHKRRKNLSFSLL